MKNTYYIFLGFINFLFNEETDMATDNEQEMY